MLPPESFDRASGLMLTPADDGDYVLPAIHKMCQAIDCDLVAEAAELVDMNARTHTGK